MEVKFGTLGKKGLKKFWHHSGWDFSEDLLGTPFDHKRNEVILEELKVEPVDEKIRRYKSNW